MESNSLIYVIVYYISALDRFYLNKLLVCIRYVTNSITIFVLWSITSSSMLIFVWSACVLQT